MKIQHVTLRRKHKDNNKKKKGDTDGDTNDSGKSNIGKYKNISFSSNEERDCFHSSR